MLTSCLLATWSSKTSGASICIQIIPFHSVYELSNPFKPTNTFGLENIPQQRVPALKHCLYPSFESSPYIPAQEGMRHPLSKCGKGKPGRGAPADSRHPLFPTEPSQQSAGRAQRCSADFGRAAGSIGGPSERKELLREHSYEFSMGREQSP